MLRTALRHVRTVVVVLAVLVAAAVVTTVTVDLGPSLRERAERAGSNFIQRPMHIGRLGVHLATGRFVVEDLRIEGLTPEAEPWLTAKRIDVSLTWRALFGREVLLDAIDMTDWRMVVETFPDGTHNWPRVTGPPRAPRTGPPVVVTTLGYVHAARGEFVYHDHATPWSVTAPNLDVVVSKLADYRGQASFRDATIQIQSYEPMWAHLETSFHIEGSEVVLDRIDLETDGATSDVTGRVDLANWPEQTYDVVSRVRFPRMRELFFARDTFALHGEGDFRGRFHLFKGGRELTGTFASAEAGLNDLRFPDLEGELVWTRDRFEVTRATSGFYGGTTDFTYRMAPFGDPNQPARADFDADYRGVDLRPLTATLAFPGGLRLAGTAEGRNEMSWPLGRFADREGRGTIAVAPPPGRAMQGRALPARAAANAAARAEVWGPFSSHLPLAPIPIAGTLTYEFDGEGIDLAPSEVATEETFIAFRGETAWGERSRIPFHVTSTNWQESDRLLAALMTAFGARTTAIPVDGVGEFDGVMLGAFRRPRIEGRFEGDAMRAFDVTWGAIAGDVVIENAYAIVEGGVVRAGDSEMQVDGRFSLGYPRADGGEEIDARVRIENRPVPDFLAAFDIEDYPVDGRLTGDFRVTGEYTRPVGYGRMTIDDGIAYDEPFETASADMRFEGAGVRLDGIQAVKAGGAITGAAYVGWNGTYSFNADGRRLAVEALALADFEELPPFTGFFDFSAAGSGTFEAPRYDVKVNVRDLFVGEEGIGQVTGRLAVRDTVLTYELEAASPRLAVSGTGRMALTDEGDAELSFRVTDTSLDPYVRVIEPTLSPYVSAVASGTIRVVGELYNPEAVRVDTSVEQLDLRFFDYQLRNAGPIRVALEREVVQVDALRLVGDGTSLDVRGSVDLPREALSLQAEGAANLAVLQGFLPDIRSSGRADVTALVGGTLDQPVVTGQALITDGRLRHFSFPHALEALNGIVGFNASGLRLDGLTGRLGGGAVKFGGRISPDGYQVGEIDVTAVGEDMRLRFPEGMRSVIDATLSMQGPASAPLLTGTVIVESATWTQGFGAAGGVFGGGDEGGGGVPTPAGAVAAPSTLPLRYDVRIVAPSTLEIENDQARIVASADLNVRGTFDRPLLFGRADIERGEVRFEGRRYVVTRGSLDFTNPTEIQPFFDVEAETRVRVPGQTYNVTLRMAGTTERLQPEFTSDPPLPAVDILTLLFSDTAPSGDVELASLRTPNQREQDLLQARATRALTGVLSDEVGRVVEQTFGVDMVQITPLLVDPYQQSSRLNVNPAARVTIGKRISDRIYLTYARSLSSSTRDEIILLEYDQSDSLAWVLSQNEDRTYALEVRKRHTF